MLKIGTHDSATGESGKCLLSWLITPFSKTQSKTIKEQLDAGCRLFDIRVKRYGDTWRCAHGLWKSKKTAWEIIGEINDYDAVCAVWITYEGKGKDNDKFLAFVDELKRNYTNICYGGVAVKYGDEAHGVKVKYTYLLPMDSDYASRFGTTPSEQAFVALDGRSWHTYLPIPWLWYKIYKCPNQFVEDKYRYVDFL